MIFRFLPIFALSAVSGCLSLEDLNTDSEFATPLSSGSYAPSLSNQRAGDITNFAGEGVGYRVGNDPEGGFTAQAGVIPGSTVTAPPTAGSASYSGAWELAKITSIFVEGGNINGFSSTDSGTITLTANFDDGSLSGASGGLEIDGRVNGGELSGDVTYNGTQGDLDGLIGGDEAMGAFHGNDGDQVYAGGFVVEAN